MIASAGVEHTIELTLQGRYTGGGSEISAYDQRSERLFVIDAANERVDIIGIADPFEPHPRRLDPARPRLTEQRGHRPRRRGNRGRGACQDRSGKRPPVGLATGFKDHPQLLTDDLTAFGRLTVTRTLGNTDSDPAYEALYAFGARSFSIWSASEQKQVFDSGDAIEQVTATQLPSLFNSESGARFDTRSDNKGNEPEGLALGEIRGQTYAFIGLERIGGVMVHDAIDRFGPQFVQYVDPEPAVDRAPAGVLFIPKADSPTENPLLVVANEVSGTTAIHEIS